jgi:hypothetical protein
MPPTLALIPWVVAAKKERSILRLALVAGALQTLSNLFRRHLISMVSRYQNLPV